MSFALNQFTGFSVPSVSGPVPVPTSDADWNFAVDRSLTDSIAGATFTLTRSQASGNVATHYDSAGDLVRVAADTARWQYHPVTGASLGLLCGGDVLNTQPYCEQICNGAGGAWTNTNITWGNNNTDFLGTTIAELVRPTTTSGIHRTKGANKNLGILGDHVSASMFFKSDVYSAVKFKMDFGSGGSFEFFFDTDTGVIGDTAGTTPVAYGVQEHADGWWQAYIMNPTITSTLCSLYAYVCQGTSTGDDDFAPGSGSDGLFMCGAMLSNHSLISSGSSSEYIPQYTGPTTTSQITYDEEIISVALGAWFNNTEGTLVVEYHSTAGQSTQDNYVAGLTADPGSSLNGMWMRDIPVFGSASRAQINMYDTTAQVSDSIYSLEAGNTERETKVAIAWKLNDTQTAANGTVSAVDTACTVPTVDTLRLNSIGSTLQYRGERTISRVRLWKTRLTGPEIASATTVV